MYPYIILIVGLCVCAACLTALWMVRKKSQMEKKPAIGKKEWLFEEEFPQENFVPTSAYYQFGDDGSYAGHMMFLDVISKRIAFAYDFDDVKYLDFDEIKSCKILSKVGIGGSKQGQSGSAASERQQLLLSIATDNLRSPILNLDIFHCGRDLSKDSTLRDRSFNFALEMKAAIDKIIL